MPLPWFISLYLCTSGLVSLMRFTQTNLCICAIQIAFCISGMMRQLTLLSFVWGNWFQFRASQTAAKYIFWIERSHTNKQSQTWYASTIRSIFFENCSRYLYVWRAWCVSQNSMMKTLSQYNADQRNLQTTGNTAWKSVDNGM